MKSYHIAGSLLLVLLAGCATTKAKPSLPVILETSDVSQAYDTLGPVSVSEQIAEDTADAIKGLAAFATKDSRISNQLPSETKAALDAKTVQYKEMIFAKLAEKADSSDADAVIGAQYKYVPPYVNLSPKATVSAQGTMIKYKKK